MPHLLGSIARAQIERFSKYILKEKIRVGKLYRKIFRDNSEFNLTQTILKGSKSSFWLNSLYFKKIKNKKLILLGKELEKKNIEIRSGFWPLSHLKGFKPIILENGTSMNIFKKTIVLPSDWSLSENDIKYIYNTVVSLIKKFSK
jgi:perosamine synthetase